MLTEKQRETLIKNNEESRAITREAIRGALLLIIKEKAYCDISVTEIIKKSGVSRSAFYRNYKSKDEVLFDALDGVFEEMIGSLERSLEKNLRIIFFKIMENQTTLQILVNAGLEYHILDIINKHIVYGTNRYEAYIWNGVLYNIILEWIKMPSEGTVEDVISEIMDSLYKISNAILNHSGNFSNDIIYRRDSNR